MHSLPTPMFFFFFFNDTATTEIYTLSLHDALPISGRRQYFAPGHCVHDFDRSPPGSHDRNFSRNRERDRKSTRLNSSHTVISYAVFCLKKNKRDKFYLLCSDVSQSWSHSSV